LNPLLAFARSRGHFLRRLLDVEERPGGLRATIELIPFGELGDERRPVILSDEPLPRQMIETHVPNRPPDLIAATDEPERPRIALDVQALAPRIVRLRLGATEALAASRDFGMLATGALESLRASLAGSADAPTLEHQEDGILLRVGGITLTLDRDPFALRLSCEGLPAATLATPGDDRDVHGLLCTPPPGLYETTAGGEGREEAFWSWALSADERLYGLGERFTSLDQRGARLTLWNCDAWGTTTEASYKYVPFLHSSRGYGLFFHTPAPVSLRLGTPSLRAAQAQAGESQLDLFVLFGADPKELLYEYTRLTGRATMPPRWAFGVWLSRCRYQTRAEVEAVAARTRAEDVPCDVLHLDPAWLEHPGLNCDFVASETDFPDLPGLIRDLGARGVKVSLWELPYMSSASARYGEAAEAGYFLRDDDGEPIGADLGAPPADGHIRAVLDFTNPAARAWWQDLHRPWLRAGVAAFKTDFGEGVPERARAANGMTGRELRNLYPLLYNAAVHEVISQETGRPGMVWGRSGWAGIQRYPAQWGGDPKTDAWSMRASLRGGLNLALSAPGIWAHDIGGFYGPPPSPALYIRWAQFGLLSPLARAHGTTPREPWEFGAQALDIFRRYANLRVRLSPYLYSSGWEAHTRGLPMLRPLVLEFPDDPACATNDDSFLLGPDLLVAPIFGEAEEPVARRLYLPPGVWVDYWTGERVAGGHSITRLAPLDILPLYVRAGAILPLGPERTFVGDEPPDEITLDVYPSPGIERTTRIIWDAAGAATEVRVCEEERDEGQGWQLEIEGERVVTWHVRWHIGRHSGEPDERAAEVVHITDLGRAASASA
jgi:alpha-D-xyloside xylohydrolase